MKLTEYIERRDGEIERHVTEAVVNNLDRLSILVERYEIVEEIIKQAITVASYQFNAGQHATTKHDLERIQIRTPYDDREVTNA